MTVMSRRQALQHGGAASLGGLALLLPRDLLTSPAALRTPDGARTWLVFTPHEAAVVEAACRRLIPGPEDDPAERGHPGAREADVVRYLDTMLGALSLSPAKVFGGGPFSDRAGSPVDDMADFIGLTPGQAHGWRIRLAGWRRAYSAGVLVLDHLAGGDFLRTSDTGRDRVLANDPDGFTSLLFGHAVEGMYSVPEYGGNRDLVGWKDISFPGDRQPLGYTPHEVSRSDGPDRYRPTGAAAKLVQLIDSSSGK